MKAPRKGIPEGRKRAGGAGVSLAVGTRTRRTAERLEAIRAKLAANVPVRVIAKEFGGAWKLDRDQMGNYIRQAYAATSADAELAAVDQRRAQLREVMEETYQLAIDAGDLRTAANLCDKLARMEGAYETKITILGGAPVAIGPGNEGATRDRIKELLADPAIRAKLGLGE